jgi:hypothetical protein
MAYSKWTTRRDITSGYKFSVETPNDPQIDILKQTVSEYNKNVDMKKRVRLMGRGPRKIYETKPGQYQSYLPYKFAKYFDVYIHDKA